MKILNHCKPVFLLLFLTAFAFESCKKDDKDPVTTDNNEIVGKWKLTTVTPETTGATIPALSLLPLITCLYDLVFTFNSDNTVAPSGCDQAVAAMSSFVPVGSQTKWKVTDGKLQLINGTTTQEFKLTQSATQFTVVVNTNTTGTGATANVILLFKKI